MARSLMICTNSKKGMTLNESESVGGKYVLEGVFAELDKLNRNQRIYPKDEYLKHLQYLRNDIKSGEPLLGELDHPDDRFEVKLKEASHRVIDLWYDSQKNVVMGKIELLDTPNGKIAKSIVDQGIPLHISSRAAGSVDPGDKKVSIQQIYTYDLVAKPGFSGAVLYRVNESEESSYTQEALQFLKKCENSEMRSMTTKYGVVNESMNVFEMASPISLRREAVEINENDNIKIDMKDLCRPLNEADEDPKDDEKDEKAENTETGEDKEEKENDGGDDGEKDGDDGVKILDVEAETGVEIKKVEPEEDGDSEESDDEKDGEDEDKDDEKDGEETDESDETVECDGKCCCDDKENAEKVENDAKECNTINEKAKKSIDDREEKFTKKIDDLIDTIKSKKEKNECGESKKCESVVLAQYPVSNAMNEENFAQFLGLSESQKNSVVAYLEDNAISTVSGINESWRNGIGYVRTEPIWLKLAPESYRRLYESSSDSVKDSLNATAEYLIFESQADINLFWENSGLMEKEEKRLLNESFVNSMPVINEQASDDAMPYGSDFIKMVTEMACSYNRAY